jgi:hypothetical protein
MGQASFDSRGIRSSLLAVVRYVNNHLVNHDSFNEIAVSHEVATLASQYFIDFSQTANQLVQNPILDDASYLQAYPHIISMTPHVYEISRLPVLYTSLYHALRSILPEKLFKQKDTSKVDRALSIRDTDLASLRLH